MRKVAGNLIILCGMVLAVVRVAIPYPGAFSHVLLEQNAHALVEKATMKTITSLTLTVSQLFVHNLITVSHIVSVFFQAGLILLLSYLLARPGPHPDTRQQVTEGPSR